MHSELHGNVTHHGVKLLLLVSMLLYNSLLAIPKSLLFLKEFLYTSLYIFKLLRIKCNFIKLSTSLMHWLVSQKGLINGD